MPADPADPLGGVGEMDEGDEGWRMLLAAIGADRRQGGRDRQTRSWLGAGPLTADATWEVRGVTLELHYEVGHGAAPFREGDWVQGQRSADGYRRTCRVRA